MGESSKFNRRSGETRSRAGEAVADTDDDDGDASGLSTADSIILNES